MYEIDPLDEKMIMASLQPTDPPEYDEEYKDIDGFPCYGTDYTDLVQLLIRYDYTPVKCEMKNGRPMHFFRREDDLDKMVDFFKLMLGGALLYWMAKMSEKYEEDDNWPELAYMYYE